MPRHNPPRSLAPTPAEAAENWQAVKRMFRIYARLGGALIVLGFLAVAIFGAHLSGYLAGKVECLPAQRKESL